MTALKWIALLAAVGYYVSNFGLGTLMLAPAVFAFGLVAFGFLGMGPVTIAVDSYGPVTDNAQSVYELSRIESIPNIKQQLKDKYGLSWQIIPTALGKMLGDPDPVKAKRVMEAMLQMGKIDIAKLQAAYDGK